MTLLRCFNGWRWCALSRFAVLIRFTFLPTTLLLRYGDAFLRRLFSDYVAIYVFRPTPWWRFAFQLPNTIMTPNDTTFRYLRSTAIILWCRQHAADIADEYTIERVWFFANIILRCFDMIITVFSTCYQTLCRAFRDIRLPLILRYCATLQRASDAASQRHFCRFHERLYVTMRVTMIATALCRAAILYCRLFHWWCWLAVAADYYWYHLLLIRWLLLWWYEIAYALFQMLPQASWCRRVEYATAMLITLPLRATIWFSSRRLLPLRRFRWCHYAIISPRLRRAICRAAITLRHYVTRCRDYILSGAIRVEFTSYKVTFDTICHTLVTDADDAGTTGATTRRYATHTIHYMSSRRRLFRIYIILRHAYWYRRWWWLIIYYVMARLLRVTMSHALIRLYAGC